MSLKIGMFAQGDVIVNESNTAAAIGSGSLLVFATPAMIALMENTAVKSIMDFLDKTQTTVGISLNIKHLKASTIGQKITATAKLTAIDGKKLTFTVEAHDDKDLIGEGIHERFIVDSEKFMNKLK
jgi:Predicted thioesterase